MDIKSPRIKLGCESPRRAFLFALLILGLIITSISTSLYLIYKDSNKEIEAMHAAYASDDFSSDSTKKTEILALFKTPISVEIDNPVVYKSKLPVITSTQVVPGKKQPVTNADNVNLNAEKHEKNMESRDDFAILMRIYSDESSFPLVMPKNWNRWDWPNNSAYDNYRPENLKLINSEKISWSEIKGKPHFIEIPILDVKSEVRDLVIVELGGIKQYESPNNFVGRISSDGAPDDTIAGWYFGHLESPIKGEGNVFHNLPNVPSLIRDGEKVYIIVENDQSKYVYQAISSEVVPAENLRLQNNGTSSIFLVTCVNRPTYDQRLVIKADMVGIIE